MKRGVLLRLEFLKSRRLHLYIVPSAVLAFLAVYLYFSLSRAKSAPTWDELIYTVPLLDSLLLPLTLAAMASRLCECEHAGHTFKLLCTMRAPQSLFDAKLVFGLLQTAALCVLQTALVLFMGVLFKCGSVPVLDLASLTAVCFSVSAMLFTLQLGLSLLFANQLIPLMFGVAGSFLGIFIMFFPPVLQRILPWGYYGVMMLVGMDWDAAAGTVSYYRAGFNTAGFALLLVWFALFLLTFRTIFAKKEV